MFNGEPRSAKTDLDRVETKLKVINWKRPASGKNLRFYTESEKQPYREKYRAELGRGVAFRGWVTGITDVAYEAKTHRTEHTYDFAAENITIDVPWYSRGILTESGKLMFVTSTDSDPLESDCKSSGDGLALAGVVSLDHLRNIDHASMGPYWNAAAATSNGREQGDTTIARGTEREQRYQLHIAKLLVAARLA